MVARHFYKLCKFFCLCTRGHRMYSSLKNLVTCTLLYTGVHDARIYPQTLRKRKTAYLPLCSLHTVVRHHQDIGESVLSIRLHQDIGESVLSILLYVITKISVSLFSPYCWKSSPRYRWVSSLHTAESHHQDIGESVLSILLYVITKISVSQFSP